MASNEVLQAVVATAEIYSRQMSTAAAAMYLADLSHIPEATLLIALSKCRRELRHFPTVSDVLARVNALDGRPGVEEAWAMLPKCESDSVVWTEEMAAAFGVCASLIAEDQIAARMAFKESYTGRVQLARDQGKPVRWVPSLGHSKEGRRAVIEEAVNLGRIASDQARALIHDVGSAPQMDIPGVTFLRLPDSQKLLDSKS